MNETKKPKTGIYIGAGILLIVGGIIVGFIFLVLPVLLAEPSEPTWNDKLLAIACQPGESVRADLIEGDGVDGMERSVQILCFPPNGQPVDATNRVFLIGAATMGIPGLLGGLLIFRALRRSRSEQIPATA